MAEHPCIHEEDLGKMTALLEKISSEIYGNGQLGLSKTIPRLEEKINTLVGTTAAHTNTIANLVTFQATHEGEERGKKIASDLVRQKRKDSFWRITTIVAIIVSALGVFFLLNPGQKKLQSEQEVTNQILAPQAVERGMNLDSLGLNK